ncbi:MAG: flagellar biosynthetic protein FliR [Lachnospiraceae bacterium]
MTFTVEHLEFYLAVVARVAGFVYTAPFYGITSIPQRAKALLSMAVSLVIYFVLPYEQLEYAGVIGYAGIVISEAIAGMILGLFANLACLILQFAGQLADMEIGFSMATTMDPSSRMQVTVTSNLLTYAVLLTMVATNLHLYILRAVIDSFTLIPLGKVSLSPLLYEGYLGFLLDYMVLAFRIILPVFAALLVVNSVLAILAKASPQLNMFVVGFQLKIFVGLSVLTLMMLILPGISDIIFEKMMEMLRLAAAYLMPQG